MKDNVQDLVTFCRLAELFPGVPPIKTPDKETLPEDLARIDGNLEMVLR